MQLTKDQIKDIAILARLELQDAELDQYARQLSVVLEYMELLQEVDTDQVEETCQVTGLLNIVRPDEPRTIAQETKKQLIEQFPDKLGQVLRVKQVFET